MQRLSVLLLVVGLVLVIPPVLLLPMVYHWYYAQLFKDLYEVCMWVSPATGLVAVLLLARYQKLEMVSLRQAKTVFVLVIALLDIVAPLYLYLLMAILAGH